jgi:hypothetical protein
MIEKHNDDRAERRLLEEANYLATFPAGQRRSVLQMMRASNDPVRSACDPGTGMTVDETSALHRQGIGPMD